MCSWFKRLAEAIEVVYKKSLSCSLKRVNFVPNKKVPRVKTNGFLFKIIFCNLLSNAIKYSNDKIKIEIISNINSVVLSITDKGIGIDKSEIPFIFDQYWRSESAKKYSNGSGVSLYFVKKIAVLLNVELKISSVLDIGTIVEIIFNEKLIEH